MLSVNAPRSLIGLAFRSGSIVRKTLLIGNVMLFALACLAGGAPASTIGFFLVFPAAMQAAHRWSVSRWVADPDVTQMWRLQPGWGRSFPAAILLACLAILLGWLSGLTDPGTASFALIGSIAATYAAGKGGCVPLGCCRAAPRYRALTLLPLREAIAGEIIFITLSLAWVLGAGWYAVAPALVAFVTLRAVSLRVRR